MKIQLNKTGVISYPSHLQGFNYSDAVAILDSKQKSAELTVDRRAENILCLIDESDPEADFYLYTIERD